MTTTPEPAGAAPIIEFTDVNKWYGEFHVLRDINLRVARGERIVICGPSGSGKSTMIRCINRLEEHQAGRLVVDGVELSDDMKAISAVPANPPAKFSTQIDSVRMRRSCPVAASRARLRCEALANNGSLLILPKPFVGSGVVQQ